MRLLAAAVAGQPEEHQEQVDEIEIERQRADDGVGAGAARGSESAIAFSRCASYAARPVNTITPMNPSTNWKPSFCQNMPTIDAMHDADQSHEEELPQPARLRVVTVP